MSLLARRFRIVFWKEPLSEKTAATKKKCDMKTLILVTLSATILIGTVLYLNRRETAPVPTLTPPEVVAETFSSQTSEIPPNPPAAPVPVAPVQAPLPVLDPAAA